MPVQLDGYETEVRERREQAVPLSRQACLDAHGPLPPGALRGRILFVSVD
jgi:hypothetical protein